MRVLITGSSGFVGRHLSRLALAHGATVFGLGRRAARPLKGVRALKADLLSERSVARAVEKARPDLVFHLAGSSSVAASWKDPEQVFRVNVDGTRVLFDALCRLRKKPRVVLAGSAEVYGRTPAGTRIRETRPLKPLNPYAVSKLAQEALAVHYGIAHRLPVVRVRCFNLTGPGQSDVFASSAFARQCAEIEKGLRKPRVEVGNLDAKRDFTDVRDAARAYWILGRKGAAGEVYNISSGKARRIREILGFYLGRASVRIGVLPKASRRRPTDIPELVGSAAKLKRLSGWMPKTSWERTLDDLYKDWMRRLS